MIVPVPSPLAVAAELPPPPVDAAEALRPALRSRGASVAVLPGLLHATAAVASSVTGRGPAAPRARPSAAGYASGSAKAPAAASSKSSATAAKPGSTPSKSSATARKSGPLAFLDDPKLSLEDKLLKLLAYLNDKWNKDLDKKMKELKTGGATASGGSSSSGSKKSSGISGALGGLVGMAKNVMPGLGVGLDLLSTPAVKSTLSSVAGPGLAALATAMGMPELAPLALQYGPEIVDAASAVAKEAGSSGSKATGSSSGSSSAAGAEPLGSDRDAQLKLMEIQRIMDQQKEMFSLTSNLLKTGHDTRMAVVQNLR